MRHQPDDLRQMQSLPLEAKILMSKQRIRQWYDHWGGMVYVSFSGGIDSTVLADLVARFCKQYGYKLYLFHVDTGLEYPEIRLFVNKFAEWLQTAYNIEVQLDIVRPGMRFDEVIKNHGYPVISKEVAQTICEARKNVKTGKYAYRLKRLNGECKDKDGNPSQYNIPQWKFLLDAPVDISHECCTVMKKNPAKQYEKETGRHPMIGTLANESRLRYSKWLQFGCNAFEAKRPTSQPLSFWERQDILLYLKKHNVPYCSVYGDIVTVDDEGNEYDMPADYLEALAAADAVPKLATTGCDRTGCIFCMFGCHLEKEPNRFQRLKETPPASMNIASTAAKWWAANGNRARTVWGLERYWTTLGWITNESILQPVGAGHQNG